MKNNNAIFDFLGSFLGVSDVDWDSDFEDDGYTDWLGLQDIGEPVFYDEWLQDIERKDTIKVASRRKRAQ
jgi:hypothetical protein